MLSASMVLYINYKSNFSLKINSRVSELLESKSPNGSYNQIIPHGASTGQEDPRMRLTICMGDTIQYILVLTVYHFFLLYWFLRNYFAVKFSLPPPNCMSKMVAAHGSVYIIDDSVGVVFLFRVQNKVCFGYVSPSLL